MRDKGLVKGAGKDLNGSVCAGLDGTHLEPLVAETHAKTEVPLQAEMIVRPIPNHQINADLQQTFSDGFLVGPVGFRICRIS
jgi:hypothetical protein